MLKRILFATDFFACAGLDQDYAICLAKAFKAEMDIVHVLELYPGMDVEYPVNHLYLEHLRKETDQQLEGVVDQVRERGVAVKSHQIIGMPSLSVTESAKTLSSDLIVLGTHGRTGLERVLLGSTAERVVAGAPCPVLAVRQGEKNHVMSSEFATHPDPHRFLGVFIRGLGVRSPDGAAVRGGGDASPCA